MCEFEKKVWNGLIACGVETGDFVNSPDVAAQGDGDFSSSPNVPRLGLAVSGGADSVSLLVSLSNIIKAPLFVITVNHNIRPAEESGGDAEFVKQLCSELARKRGIEIFCKVVELKRGAVEAEAKKRGGGIEDAARALRYEAFENFIAENNLSALCLAHNKNDQLETVLMRFLQGASLDSAGGIKERRGCFVRPFLNISRSEIENYLASREISWRTDKTNYETEYLRNKIRLKLVPFLNENFDGWQTAVLNGAEKAAQDSELIKSLLEGFPFKTLSDGAVQLPLGDFMAASDALKYRLLLEACNRAGEASRIPRQFLKDVILALDSSQNCSFTKHFASVDIICEKNHLFVKKHKESNTDLYFSDIIEETGTFEFPFGSLSVFNYKEQDGKRLVSVCAGESGVVDGVSLPFCVRNVNPGDSVLCADGSEKKVSDIFSDWHVTSEDRSLIPVVQLLNEKSQRIKAVLGGVLQYKDWIVKS